MNGILGGLAEEYARALEDYLGGGGEKALRTAYELGRRALAGGAGVLDIIAAHQTAMGTLAAEPGARSGTTLMTPGTVHVLAESLSPFEMVLRGFQETNGRLRQSLMELSRVEEELRRQNRKLTAAHAEVEAERRRYRQLFEFAPEGYLVTDLRGVICEANSAAATLLGTSRDGLAGKALVEFVIPAERKDFLDQLGRFERGETGRREDWQVLLQPLGRQVVPIALTTDVEFDAEQALQGLRWLLRDATERRRAEEERARSLLGRAEAEAARRLAFLADASAVLAESLDDETRLARVTRLAVPYLADGCAIHVAGRDGNLVQVEVAFADPGRAELAEKIRRQFLSGPCGTQAPFWLTDNSPEILDPVDDAWLERFAGGPECLDLVRRIGIVSAIVVPLTVHDARLGSLTLISTHSSRPYSPAELALAQDLGRRCALAVENARLYREVTMQRDSAARANRTKDEFLAVLSHELRNPLMPVVGWTRILSSHAAIRSDPILAEGVQALERNAQTLNRLVADCLDLARISEGKISLERVALDLNGILLASAESVREKAESRQLKLIPELCAGPLWVHGDPARLQQVVMNLLVNAVKYTGPGGTVSLRSMHRNGQAELEVHDSGIGIEPALLEQIFQPFHQGTGFSLITDSGLGLGLAIARQIVDLHGGRIWAESVGPGLGSLFRVRLPLTSGPVDSSPSKAALPPARQEGPSVRVLLVEDARDVRFLLKIELERLGFLTLEASDGEEALSLALRELPDAIVSDIKMPRSDGYELIRRIRATPELCKVPAVALTGFGRKGDIEKALAAGFDACLAKPAETEALTACLRQLTEERSRPGPPQSETPKE